MLFAVVLTLVLAGVVLLWPEQPKTSGIAEADIQSEFSKKYLVQVSLDSVQHLLDQKYGSQVSTILSDRFQVMLKNQGTMLSNFYNDNNNILKIKSQGFDIKKVDNNSIVANFDTTLHKSRIYVVLPTDVLYGILAN